MKDTTKRLIKFILVWLTTIGIFAVLFSKIKFADVIEAISRADVQLLTAGLFISFAAHIFITIPRYQYILYTLGCTLTFKEALILRMGTLPIKNVTPFKAGELSRAAYLKTKHGFPYSKGIVSIILGYILSFASLSAFALAGLFLYAPGVPEKIGVVILAVVLLSLLFLAGTTHTSSLVKRLLRLVRLKEEEFRTSRKLFLPKQMSILMLCSLVFEGCQLFNTYLLLKALGTEVPFSTFLLFGPLSIIIAVLPITFCSLGTRESAFLVFFSKFAPAEILMASSLLTTFVNRLFPLFLGLFFMKAFLDRLMQMEE